LRTGQIAAADMPNPTGCAVLNISRTGACVLVPEGAVVPQIFALMLDRENKPRRCTRVWQRGPRLGVRFIDGKDEDSRAVA
jgi:hypothetical protein